MLTGIAQAGVCRRGPAAVAGTAPAQGDALRRYPGARGSPQSTSQGQREMNMALLDLMAVFAWVVLGIGFSLIVATVTRKGTASPDQYD